MDSTTLKELLKYDGAEFPKKEIKLPLQSVWEYLGYLEISLDCFKLAIQHLDADFFMITSQIGFFSKEKIEDFISNNGYQQCNEEICSFELFNKQIYYDGNLLYKLSCEDLMEKYLLEEHKQILGYDALNAPLKKNIIENGYYRIDEFPHIKNQKYKNDFFRFFTDKEIFQELYECAKSEKKEITDFSTLLNSKLQLLNSKLCGFSEELISHLTNQTLIHWYILLQKHIGNAMSLLTDSSVNKIDTKQIVYIIKSLFEYYLDVDTKEVPFVEFTICIVEVAQLFKSKRLIIKNRKQMKKKIFILEDPEELMIQFGSQVRNTIKEELADAQKRATKKSTTNTYMSRQEVCELLHISYSTLHRWVNLEILVCYKIGRRSLFKAKEVEATLVKLNVGGGLGYGYQTTINFYA